MPQHLHNLHTRLHERITLQTPDDTPDSQGGFTRSWATLATVAAEVIPLRAGLRERLVQGQLQDTSTHRFTIRYRSDITAKDRIQWRGNHYNITGVRDVDARGIALEILATQGGAL